jgi:enediyne polyketide synthase
MEWFGQYLAGHLELGDPGRRDASVHAIQVCVPDVTLLPIGVERLRILRTGGESTCIAHARERSRDRDVFTYDLEVRGQDGSLLERWEGLRLQIIKGAEFRGSWFEPLLAPYLERYIREFAQRHDVSVAIERGGDERRSRSNEAIQRALGERAQVMRRPDGKPEVAINRTVSASHCGDITLAVAGEGETACDVERVVPRSVSLWKDLLGDERFRLAQVIASLSGDDLDAAATRAWSASECLKKAGMPFNAPLVFAACNPDRWVSLSSGQLTINTFSAPIQSAKGPFVFAVLIKSVSRSAFRVSR